MAKAPTRSSPRALRHSKPTADKSDCPECRKKIALNSGGWCGECGLECGHMKSCSKHRAHKPKAAAATRSIAAKKCDQCGAAKGANHKADCPNGRCAECGGILGHMLTCSKHTNYQTPVLDGKTGAVLETTVDGKDAKIDTTPKPKRGRPKKDVAAAPDVDDDEDEDDKGLKRLPPPKITDPELFEALQYAIDKKIIFGIKQPLAKSKGCDVEWFDAESDQSVGCAGSAAFDFEKLDTCGTCKHTSKHILETKCLPHMALRISGELKDRQIDMFEGAK